VNSRRRAPIGTFRGCPRVVPVSHAWPMWSRVTTLNPMVMNVRGAKAKLSELLDRAARGEEIIIASDGRPKARLVAIVMDARPYRVHRDLLRIRPKRRIRPAEVLIREERDGRD
jgi:prevent-host-death family protein